MVAAAYGLSILKRQHLLLGAEFLDRYAHDWLVWEPGPWRPAVSLLESNFASTQKPVAQARPSGNEPICFPLRPPSTRAVLTVGRSTTNDIVVNDLTASRQQFSLRHEQGRWLLETPAGDVRINGLTAGRSHPLGDGTAIHAGDVRLTFVSSQGMVGRLLAAEVA